MDELSIKVTIGSRIYPLKINHEEEERVRKAAKMVNDRIREYEEQYAVNDKMDLINMCALQIATELVNQSEKHPAEMQSASKGITEIDSTLTAYFKTISVH